jgi:hypothetical protein
MPDCALLTWESFAHAKIDCLGCAERAGLEGRNESGPPEWVETSPKGDGSMRSAGNVPP